jgi:hypothetical protein
MRARLRLGFAAALALCATAPLCADDGVALKRELLAATVRAIELEIEACGARLRAAGAGTGPRESVERLRAKLEALEAERSQYARMAPEQYPNPVRQDAAPVLEPSPGFGPVLPPLLRDVRVAVEGPQADGFLLPVEGTSRSGPFYRLAGIAGSDYGVLRRGKLARLTVCLVYRREYFGLIGDYYVYILDPR